MITDSKADTGQLSTYGEGAADWIETDVNLVYKVRRPANAERTPVVCKGNGRRSETDSKELGSRFEEGRLTDIVHDLV
jgi:hypothetical protein